MEVFSKNKQTYFLWIILMVMLGGIITILNVNKELLLRKVGDSAPSSSVAGGDDYLEIKAAYGRLLEKYHQNGPAGRTNPQLANDPDFQTVVKKLASMEKFPRKGIAAEHGVPLEMILSDVLWMAGRSGEARDVLVRAADGAGLALIEKNLLTVKPQSRESNLDPDRTPE